MNKSQEISAHEQAVIAVLGKLDRKIGDSYVSVDGGAHTSAEELNADGVLSSGEDSLEYFWQVKAVRAMFGYCCRDGYDPAAVLKNFYCLAKAFFPELLGNMSDADIAIFFDETRAAVSARRNRIVTKKLEEAGFKGTRVRCQKSASSIAKYAAAQKGNRNRAKKKPAAAGAPPS